MTKGASKNPSAQILIEYHTNEICKSETQASLIFFPAITSLRTCTLHQCYRLNVCICLPPNSYIEILTPNMIFFRRSVFGRWLCHEEGQSPHGWVSYLIRETPEGSPALFVSSKDTSRRQQSANWVRALTRLQPCWHPRLRLLASGTVRHKFPL